MLFRNNTNAAIRIHWLDYQGQRKFYKELLPGQQHVQPTFISHPWIVTDKSDRCLAFHMPGPGQHSVDIR